ncbi:MAG: protease modulator HflC [Desulfobacteraceae bacterium]|nr:protease modulator HflC [Desulfobacteraceae bacterium]MBC2755423.1 protease modulator HflC [Desulfobacteraceae bacterium]
MKIIAFIGSAALVLLVVSISSFTVSEREYAVVTRFGKPVNTVTAAGFNWKYPGFIDRVNRFDRRLNTFTTQPIQLLLGDKNPIVMTCYICWCVRDPLLFFQSLLTADIATQKLGDMVNSQLGNALGDYNLSNIINTSTSEVKVANLEGRILKNTNSLAQEKYGIEVAQVGIRRIAYPRIVADAVYNRMRSEREKEAMKFRAEGKEESTKIKAKADREVTEILAEAYKEAQILKGEGDQKALKIYSGAYGKDLAFFEFTKSMEVYKDILGQKSTLVLSTDANIFRYLNNPEGETR